MNWQQVQAVDDELTRVLGARPQDAAACIPVLERAAALCRTDPAAAQTWVEVELLGELVDCYETVDRVDAAIATMQRALEVGWHGEPDGRCRIAELLMRDGRVEQAVPIWQQVLADTPDDVWLYNNAGFEYAAIGDHREALTWLTRGLQLAIDTRDPERLVDQLAGLRAESLTALGHPADELQAAAAAFLADPPPRPARTFVPPTPPPPRSGGERRAPRWAIPDLLPTDLQPRESTAGHPSWPPNATTVPATAPDASVARAGESVVVALAWFPADEYPQALELWPTLATEGPAKGAADHAAYSRALQRTLTEYADGGFTRLRIAPIRIPEYLAWCRDRGEDPATGPTRASYCADLARRRDPGVLVWPPARNQRCWCGSGRKYKQCCGTAGA